MRNAIVVGSGAGGATIAKELQGFYQVSVLEAGGNFRPFRIELEKLEPLRRSGLLFDVCEISLAIPAYRVRKTSDGMVLLNGSGLGGTTTICTGNALRMDGSLKALGIDLDAEFEEVYREIPVSTAHQQNWHSVTRRLFDIFGDTGLNPQPMPKMGNYERCLHCGRCQLGCPGGIKWDSRRYLAAAQASGAQVFSNCRVESVALADGRAAGVWARYKNRRRFFPADLVVLAAGGFETPAILERSGIACEARLFVDPVLCVAGRSPKSMQHKDVTMPFVSAKEHIILSPYFDHLSYFFNRNWRMPAGDILSIMIKLADDDQGHVSGRGVEKSLTARDRLNLQEGVGICRQILRRCGIPDEEIFLGTMIAGHPGGALPLSAREAVTLHPGRLPENLYAADASLLPESLGNPPILTLIALAKRIAKNCREA